MDDYFWLETNKQDPYNVQTKTNICEFLIKIQCTMWEYKTG